MSHLKNLCWVSPEDIPPEYFTMPSFHHSIHKDPVPFIPTELAEHLRGEIRDNWLAMGLTFLAMLFPTLVVYYKDEIRIPHLKPPKENMILMHRFSYWWEQSKDQKHKI